ncbi:16531_t:CDS:2 [Funneliformis geosporum]|uniref:6875_t:CDS:1 n=1 Tax=Funneliformis geosporum TaxID=1117311 RepID=A0A9W4X5K5_9GLOM|nr:16531_t:CDS:2 [Funneliformis geosporum]CAI2188174.1 6875_t:CDS:2 [Funneliformis geosporum]
MADQYIEVPGSSNNNNYANFSLIEYFAERTCLGWLGTCIREPYSLAQSKHKIVFIGPPGSAICFEEACIKDVDDGLNITNILYDQNFRGWRRKRIRKCKIQIIKQAFAQVQGEVPGSPIFIMPLARDARHLEVQVLADRYGNAIHYLKEIVRFKDVIKRSFKRLPLRLQNKRHLNRWKGLLFEHPTTEMVSGVNLPAAQLQIAMWISLHQIRDIRVDLKWIDFDFRIPSLFKLKVDMQQKVNSTNVWGYFSVNSAGGLHEFADSQFGHIFAYGENRQQSRKNMIVALKELSIRGDFRTTVEYLIKLLETQAFEENSFTTGWLDMLISDENLTAEKPDKMLAVICGAVTKAYTAAMESIMEYKRFLEKGQIPSKDILRTVFIIDFIYEVVHYKFTATRSAPDSFTLYLNGSKVQVSVRALTDGGLLVLLDGKSHTCYFREEVQGIRLMIDSKTCLLEQENDPTQLRSLSPGKLVRFLVESGDHVKRGEAYAEIEVMKMYMPLIATEDGIVQFIKQQNSTLESGDIIGILTLDDPSRVRHALPFEGQLPAMNPPVLVGDKAHQRYCGVKHILECILDGYDNQAMLQSSVKELIELLENSDLPYLESHAVLSALSGRIPAKLEAALLRISNETHSQGLEYPAKRLKEMDNYSLDFVKPSDLSSFKSVIAPVNDILKRYVCV